MSEQPASADGVGLKPLPKTEPPKRVSLWIIGSARRPCEWVYLRNKSDGHAAFAAAIVAEFNGRPTTRAGFTIEWLRVVVHGAAGRTIHNGARA